MNIFYVSNSRMPTEKAHGLQISKMCEAFTFLDNKITLLIPARFNYIKSNIFDYYDINIRFKIVRLPNIDLINVIKNKFGFVFQNVSFSFSVFFYLFFYKGKITIYSRDYFTLFLLSFLDKATLFYEVHTFPNKLNFFYKIVLKRVKFVAITKGLRNELFNHGVADDRILIAHDGVDIDLFNNHKLDKVDLRKKLNLPKDKKIIAYVGKLTTMGKSKGVELLLEAFVKVLNDCPQAFLLLVGINKDEVVNIKQKFDKFGVKSKFYKLILHVNYEKIIDYEKSSDVLVMSYPNTKHYQLYMSPLKMFEYMASGVPIVSSDLESIREVLSDDSAVLVQAENINALGKGIKNILSDDNLAIKIANKAKQDVGMYTWKIRAKKILDFVKH
jgi:glycosyltransferase involved in cell wall biosynthesis